MEISIEERDELRIAKPVGRLDSDALTSFESQLTGHVELEGSALVIDFSSLDYVSSAGLRSILVLAKKAEQNSCKFCLAELSPEIMEIFQITGFHNIVPIHDSVQDAIETVS